MAARKKNKSLTTVLIIAALTLVAGIIALVWLAGGPVKKEMKEVTLFFSDADGLYLKAEKQVIEKGDPATEAGSAIKALLNGPKDPKLAKTLPDGTKLLSVRINGTVATVDLSAEVITRHEGGSSGELQTIYSVVNTLAVNFPAIKEVQILVEGKKEDTIAGHIDITQPLGPDMKTVKD